MPMELVYWSTAVKVFNFTIKNNTIHDLYGGGIVIVAPSEGNITAGSYYPYGFDVNGNTIYNIASNGAVSFDTGMFSTPTQSYVRNNIITNIGLVSVANVDALQLEYTQNMYVTNNYINGIYTSLPDGDGIEIDWAWADATKLSNGDIVCGNTVTGANTGVTSSGIRVFAGTNTTVCNNLTYGNYIGISNPNSNTTGNVFYNNTMVNNSYGAGVDGLSGSGVATTWIDNIFAYNSVYGFKISNNFMAPTETYNDWYSNGTNIYNVSGATSVAISATDLTSNPNFVNVASKNYSLNDGSPMIGSGFRYLGNYTYLNTSDITGFTTNAPTPREPNFCPTVIPKPLVLFPPL